MKSGLYGWLNKNMTHTKGRKGQQGFTLIELLVVVTILGVLAAIVTLSLVGLTTNASVQSCNSEYKTVQAAIDAAMASNNLGTITATSTTTATNDMKFVLGTSPAWVVPVTNPSGNITLFNDNPGPKTPNYTRNGRTQFYYTWDANGKILSISKTATATDTLSGCAPI
jgi:prepilin-type N-terminal cleavage/methylation domain-containing protein